LPVFSAKADEHRGIGLQGHKVLVLNHNYEPLSVCNVRKAVVLLWLGKAELPSNAYVVVVTRGHRHDLDALRALATRELRYVGLIGSKAKVKRIYDALLGESVPIESLSRVYAPIGLDIGAVTPEEIAVSILAELIAVRRGKIEEPHLSGASLRWKQLAAIAAKG